jgi:hypothetical protein
MEFAPGMKFNFARHFGLLALFAAGLEISGPLLGGLGIGAQFALFGALHAAALALCIVGTEQLSPSRSLLFVAVAALLALATARLGLLGYRSLGAGTSALCAVLVASASLGAVAYGGLINAVLGNSRGAAIPLSAARPRPTFGLASLGATSLGCAAAMALSVAVSREWQAAGVLALAVPWWFAFSGGLWCAAHRRAVKIAV